MNHFILQNRAENEGHFIFLRKYIKKKIESSNQTKKLPKRANHSIKCNCIIIIITITLKILDEHQSSKM